MLPDNVLAWLNQQLNQPCTSIELLAGDASFRQYYRCTTKDKSFILAHEPTDSQLSLTIAKAQILTNNNIPIPKIYNYCNKLNVCLQTDLGKSHLFDLKGSAKFFTHAQQAYDLIIKFNNQANPNWPIFNTEHIHQECKLLTHWLLPMLNITWNTQQIQTYNTICSKLNTLITSLPLSPMHRDYHSRNLMIHENNIVIIDYQDAMLGPCLYDLASLLKDCYVAWPETVISKYLTEFYQQKSTQFKSFKHYIKCFEWIALQRHLKAIGIFARLAVRDNKTKFLQDIPYTLQQIRATATKYPDLAPLLNLLPNELSICK